MKYLDHPLLQTDSPYITVRIPLICLACMGLMITTSNCHKASSVTSSEHRSPSPTPQSALIDSIDQLLHASLQDSLTAGAVVHIAQDGHTIYHKAVGYARISDDGRRPLAKMEPMTVDHVYDLASLTKVLATTYAIMLMVDDGLVGIDDPVSHYIPNFSGGYKDSITLRHLLTHTAGLQPWLPVYFHADTPAASIDYITHLPVDSSIGVVRRYSDLGFMLLGSIVERVSGSSLDRYLKDRLYIPLQLSKTTYTPTIHQGPFAVTSYGNPFEHRMIADDGFGYHCHENVRDFMGWRKHVLSGEVNDGNAHHAFQGVAGHAGLFSTAAEVARLVDLLLTCGVYQDRPIISCETISQFLTQDDLGHGLGWAMAAPTLPQVELPVGSFGHTGFTGTFALGVPDRQMSIVVLTNRQHMDVGSDGHYPSVTLLRSRIIHFALQL